MTAPIINTVSKVFTAQKVSVVTGNWQKMMLRARIFWRLFELSFKLTKNPVKAAALLQGLNHKYKDAFGEALLTKAIKVDQRYYWRLGVPGFPSQAFDLTAEHELKRLLLKENPRGVRTLLFAMTKRCPLHCEHCFEWPNLGQKEVLTVAEIIQIVQDYQDYGTTEILLSGGEPMLRVKDIYQVLKAARPGSDFWILTSGLGLSKARAIRLKKAGLTGVMVSLDHFEAEKHDQFRGFDGAFHWATQALINANNAGLVTTLSLCPTKSFLTQANLKTYMELAKKLGATFVQIVEPRAAGKYNAHDEVELGHAQLQLLNDLYITYNGSAAFQDYPIVNYVGYLQRRVGCSGAGNRLVYVDTDGDAHVCPFCGGKVASALKFPPEDIVNLLESQACSAFESNRVHERKELI